MSAPRRILYVVSLFPCWSETFIVREIERVIAGGSDVNIFSLKPAQEKLVQPDAERLLGRVRYSPRGLASFGSAVAGFSSAPGASIAFLFRILARFASEPVELVKNAGVWWRTLAMLPQLRKSGYLWIHAHWATYPSTAAMFLSRALGVPFSFTAHAHDIFVNDHLVAEKIRKSGFTATISEYNRKLLTEKTGDAADEKIAVVHCGIEPAQIPFIPGDRDAGNILAVGRFDPIKGFPDLVAACAELKTRGLTFRCELIGDGPLRDEIEALIERHGLEDNVYLAGVQPIDYVRSRLETASIFCLPSRPDADGNMDGIPVALMEAMAAGAAVVTTRVSGIPELVQHGVSGYLVDPGAADQLADRIAALIEDPAHAREFARQARAAVVSGFDINSEADKLVALIDKKLAGKHVENETAPGYR